MKLKKFKTMPRYLLTFLILILIPPKAAFSQEATDCNTLQLKIKESAQRHIDNGEKMKTEMVIDVFQNNDRCYSSAQIVEIYELEYARLKKETSNFWSQFLPNAGWITAAILFLLFVLKESLKNLISTIYKSVGNWLYRRFSGSRLFRRALLRKYRKALVDKYEKINIVFRPNRPLKMAEVFVPLKVLDTFDQKQMDVLKAILQYDKVVVLGDPGSGKSMLCKNILFNYGVENFGSSLIPVLLELHRLNDNDQNIEELLQDELARNDFPNAKSFIQNNLKQGNLLLLFDGYDEINSRQRYQITEKILDFMDVYEKCHFVITSRIAVYNNEFAAAVDKTLEMVDFNQQQIRTFLQSWGTDMPVDKSIDQLMLTLQERPRIMRMATNPLILTIIAYLYTDTPHKFPHSRGEFYEMATDVLLKQWHVKHNNYDSRDKALILQHLALVNQDNARGNNDDRKLIHYAKAKEEIEKILPRMNQDIENVQFIIDEIIERSGLLLSVDGGEYYQFGHLTMQEYYCAKQLVDQQEGLFERFKEDRTAWIEPLKLWCGLVNDTSEMIEKIFTIDPVVAFECLADARSVEPELADRIIDHFKGLLATDHPNHLEIERAFGTTASDLRPRGQDILNYLKDRLQASNNESEVLAVANALSYTYLPAAAPIIASRFQEYKQLRESLLRMGDIAIPALSSLVRENHSYAFLCLKQIATPNSVLSLLNLIWEDSKTATNAAWILADLIRFPNLEEVMRRYPLSAGHKVFLAGNEWVWRPFNEPSGSSLPVITARIVDLIKKEDSFDPDEELEIDRRILLPLVVLYDGKEPILDHKLLSNHSVIKNEHGTREFLRKGHNPNYSISLAEQVVIQKILNRKTMHPSEGLSSLLNFNNPISYFLGELTEDTVIEWNKMNVAIGRDQKITKEHWTNIFKPLDYNFVDELHYRAVVVIYILLSLLGLYTCGYILWQADPLITFWNIVQLTFGLLTLFCLIKYVLGNDEESVWEDSDLFFAVALLGFISIPLSLLSDGWRWKDTRWSVFSLIAWAPFIGYYCTIFMLFYLSTSLTIVIWLSIIGIAAGLILWGQRLERKSFNPLSGLLEVS